MKNYNIDWSKIESCGLGVSGGEKKIKLDELPKGGKYIPKDRINWHDSVGCRVYALYDDIEYAILLKKYENGKLYIDIDGFYSINYKIDISNFVKCKISSLINNIYANPNTPYREQMIALLGEEKCKTLTKGENKKIDVTCPNCKKTRPIEISKLTERGYSCIYCSNKVSYAENLLASVLDKLEVVYETEKTFVGEKFRYDFYIPKFNAIIETHGIQHYVQTSRKGDRVRTLDEEKANDKAKRDFALSNGILDYNYHEIDCRESNLDWCKPRIIEVLQQYVDLSTLIDNDWKDFDRRSQRNILIEICDYYNDTKKSTKDIAKDFNIKPHSTLYYLRRGAKLGICSFDGQEVIKGRKKPIIAINVDTQEEIYFESVAKLRDFGFHGRNIKKCLENPSVSHKGYKLKLA